MRIRSLAALVALAAAASIARPAPLAAQIGHYTFKWTGSGVFAGKSLVDQSFTLQTGGDVANATHDAITSRLDNLAASLDIVGVGTYSLVYPVYVSSTDLGAGYGVAGFGVAPGALMLGLWSVALQGYDLTTSVGPISATAVCTPTPVPPCTNGTLRSSVYFYTSGGTIAFREITNASFTASLPAVPTTATPEPATAALVFGGLAALGVVARRRPARS